MTDEQDRLLLEVVGRMPAVWQCLDCGHLFPNGPMDPAPYAFRSEPIPHDPRGRRRIVGEICKACHAKGETR